MKPHQHESESTFAKPTVVAKWSQLKDRSPTHAVVENVDLVVTRYDEKVSVLYGRCLHRGALMADGRVEGDSIICGLHDWDYRLDSGVSEYNNNEVLQRFTSSIDLKNDAVLVDAEEVRAWASTHPQPYDRKTYLGVYQDTPGTPLEPHVKHIQELARNGLSNVGHHGPMTSMGVMRTDLPSWDDIQILTAQLATQPLLDDQPVATGFTLGPRAKRPLHFEIPIFVSDMSFGALSEQAKVALAKGAEMAGTGICSGEGGMLPEEQQSNSRYLYELASARFGWSLDKVKNVQAFHFKGGQGAKTGTGGHLPGNKVQGKIAEVRGLAPGQSAISPSTFPDLHTSTEFRALADQVREVSGGIPIGFKISAQHIEADIDFALEASADYIILDGRGGGTGAAPKIFRDHISVPTMAALARARRHLNSREATDVSLIVTGGLRTETDFVKAMALGADAVAVSNSAMQAIGCLGMRACQTNNCPVGIATQKEHLRKRLQVEQSAHQLHNYLTATTDLMKVLARACGHSSLNDFALQDLTAWKKPISELTGVGFSGLG